jgi:hypothetical protein
MSAAIGSFIKPISTISIHNCMSVSMLLLRGAID